MDLAVVMSTDQRGVLDVGGARCRGATTGCGGPRSVRPGSAHPFHTHCRSRAITALRCAGVCSRRVRPTSRGCPSAAITIRVMSASHRQRASSDIATGVPSSKVAGATETSAARSSADASHHAHRAGPGPGPGSAPELVGSDRRGRCSARRGGPVRGRAAPRRSRRARAARCAGDSSCPTPDDYFPRRRARPHASARPRHHRLDRRRSHDAPPGRAAWSADGLGRAGRDPAGSVGTPPVPAQTRSASMTSASADACPGCATRPGADPSRPARPAGSAPRPRRDGP